MRPNARWSPPAVAPMSASQSKAVLRTCLIYWRQPERLQDGEQESREPGDCRQAGTGGSPLRSVASCRAVPAPAGNASGQRRGRGGMGNPRGQLEELFRAVLRRPHTFGNGVGTDRGARVEAGIGPDVGDARRAVQRVHVDQQGREFCAPGKRGLPAGKRRRQATRLQAVGAEFIDLAELSRLDRRQKWKRRIAVHLEAGQYLPRSERIGGKQRPLALGRQFGGIGETAQDEHAAECADIGGPATEQLPLGLRRGDIGLGAGRYLSGIERMKGERREFIEHDWFSFSCNAVSYTHLTLPTIYSV